MGRRQRQRRHGLYDLATNGDRSIDVGQSVSAACGREADITLQAGFATLDLVTGQTDHHLNTLSIL